MFDSWIAQIFIQTYILITLPILIPISSIFRGMLWENHVEVLDWNPWNWNLKKPILKEFGILLQQLKDNFYYMQKEDENAEWNLTWTFKCKIRWKCQFQQIVLKHVLLDLTNHIQRLNSERIFLLNKHLPIHFPTITTITTTKMMMMERGQCSELNHHLNL